jgi:hypothetical protein
MRRLPKHVLYYGRDEPPAEQVPLRAGPLSAVYVAGDLRYIRFSEWEVVRRIYVAVRDCQWGTLDNQLSNVQMDLREDAFSITYDAMCREGEIDFAWRAEITGKADGTVTFVMDGKARSTFGKNRIGVCVLHPPVPGDVTRPGPTGKPIRLPAVPCRVEHSDGTVERGFFPAEIAPHQPFKDIRAFTHEIDERVSLEIRYVGDVFEMEDQRNWSDASFKTYSTPLALPYPARIAEGTRVQQRAVLRLQGTSANEAGIRRSTPEMKDRCVMWAEPRGRVPAVGLGLACRPMPLDETEMRRLRALNLHHLRVELDLGRADYPEALAEAAGQAAQLGVALEAAVILAGDVEPCTGELVRHCRRLAAAVWRWMVFDAHGVCPPVKAIEAARKVLAGYDRSARFGSGSNVHFTELNRNRPPVRGLDFVCYGTTPQVHAFDNLSLVETHLTHHDMVRTARSFCGATKPLSVTPITLRPRSRAEEGGPPDRQAKDADPRQMSLLCAGWTLALLGVLGEQQVSSVTLYETVGPRGVMGAASGRSADAASVAMPPDVFPTYHVLADVGEFSGGTIHLPRHVPGVGAVLLSRGEPSGPQAERVRFRTMLANLTSQPVSVHTQSRSRRARVRCLDETNAEAAMSDPEAFRSTQADQVETTGECVTVAFGPYGMATIDWETDGTR